MNANSCYIGCNKIALKSRSLRRLKNFEKNIKIKRIYLENLKRLFSENLIQHFIIHCFTY